MITNIPFEIARDIAYFELHKKLTALKEKDPSGSPEGKTSAFTHLKEYEKRTSAIFDYGIEEAELKNILEDFKTSPISLQSCANIQKQTYMIQEMELLLTDDYDRENFVIRLIKAYGYNDLQAEKILDTVIEQIRSEGKLVLSVFDKVNELLAALAVE